MGMVSSTTANLLAQHLTIEPHLINKGYGTFSSILIRLAMGRYLEMICCRLLEERAE